ncbi:MAG TPA: YgdI/YgdR family lipoprotein [Verrucomicrobiae bacterium]|nr:YgdI/YgdR family lipoprotein [Verrucomicrobiae bacterium]
MFPLLLGLALCGCARHYVITLNNGVQVGAKSKPKLKGGYYTFKDAMGEPSRVPAGRVREIAPSSMVRQQEPPFVPTVR